MKTILVLFSTGLIILVLACQTKPRATVEASPQDVQKRGEYLVTIMGCNDCHTPKIMTGQGPAPDGTRLLSGHPAGQILPEISSPEILRDYALFSNDLTATIGPWGTSFAANLNPDPSGLGNWSFENFERVFREGKFKGLENGRPILPPMPWQNLQNISDEDLNAIWIYLKSIPPVKNVVPAYLPPQPEKTG